MVQRRKAVMRQALVEAAQAELAERGFAGAALASIAARAGTSIGNLYKYFENKEQLFAAAIPQEVGAELMRMIELRVQSLGTARDVQALPAGHPYLGASEALLTYGLRHRAPILFLLRHGAGTSYELFAEVLVARLVALAIGYATAAYPRLAWTPGRRRALTRIYRAFVASLASVLAEETTAEALREAHDHLSAHHLAGLRAFFEAAAGTAPKEIA